MINDDRNDDCDVHGRDNSSGNVSNSNSEAKDSDNASNNSIVK